MSQQILVTGGTGTLGRLVVPRLQAAGAEVRVLSRHPKDQREGVTYYAADLDTGAGVEEAMRNVDVIVHAAGASKGDGDKARVLIPAARAAGAGHIVYISVIGADRVPQTGRLDRAMFGYFGSKLDAEHVIEQSGIGWTTLRAAQFHDLVLTTAKAMAKLPVIPVPGGMRAQPVDAGEVADRLAELALGDPQGLVPDLAGPETITMAEAIRDYLKATGKRRVLFPVHVPGQAARAFRDGANLAPAGHPGGKRTWSEFLAASVATSPR
jgi:uncharacterized protein YbjT (DUF2867 family)